MNSGPVFFVRFFRSFLLFIGVTNSLQGAATLVSWYDWEIPEGGTERVFGLSSGVLDGGGPVTFSPMPIDVYPRHIEGSDVFFTRRATSGVFTFFKRNLETDAETLLFTLPDRPTLWNFEISGDRLYYADSLADKVWSFSLDGTDGVLLYQGRFSPSPAYLTLSGSHLFWSEHSISSVGQGAILGIDLENTTEIITLASELGRPQAIASSNDHLFWYDSADRTIYRSDFLGSEIVPIVTSTGVNRGGGFIADEEYLYWAHGRELKRSDHDGGNIEIFDTANRTFSLIFLETIPEPSSLSLFTLGFVFVLSRRRPRLPSRRC